MNLLVLVGSTRPGSYNAQLADLAIADLPADVTVTRFDRLGELPFYEEHTDAAGGFPAIVDEFRATVSAADAILVVTPEYNGGMSALLKNALDIASRPRAKAPIAGKLFSNLAATAAPGGAQSARAGAVEALVRAQAQPILDTIGVSKAYETIVDGHLTDEALESEVRALVAQLVEAPVAAA